MALLDWCGEAGIAAIPYGGGSSVVGGVEPDVGDGYAGAVSIDLRRLDRVLEIDRTSRAARIQAGVLGPALEDQLRPHGLTLRHFPQSFEFSTLGGWIATRSGGHYATLYTHIDDFVESLRVVTPTGRRRDAAPARLGRRARARPPVHRLRGHARHHHRGVDAAPGPPDAGAPARRSASRRDDGFLRAAQAVRALSQSGLYPTQLPAARPGRGARPPAPAPATPSLLVLGFESADHDLDAWMARALECCARRRRHAARGAGRARAATSGGAREGAAGAWRTAFLQAPYLRDALVALGRDRRDLRDGDHLGPLRGVPRRRQRGAPATR